MKKLTLTMTDDGSCCITGKMTKFLDETYNVYTDDYIKNMFKKQIEVNYCFFTPENGYGYHKFNIPGWKGCIEDHGDFNKYAYGVPLDIKIDIEEYENKNKKKYF